MWRCGEKQTDVELHGSSVHYGRSLGYCALMSNLLLISDIFKPPVHTTLTYVAHNNGCKPVNNSGTRHF